jgi:hypothetical protein
VRVAPGRQQPGQKCSSEQISGGFRFDPRISEDGLYSSFKPAQKSKEVEVREKAETITDPIARWAYLHFNLPKEEDNAPFRINYKMRWEQ